MTSHRLRTDFGTLELRVAGDGALVGLAAVDAAPDGQPSPEVARPVVDALDRYFDGDLAALDDVEVRFETGTPFQHEVWAALRDIPAGRTISYAELASRVGRPTAFRAVGAANGANPVAVVVPCHRVVGADGGLGGYAYGVDMKRRLLVHEGATIAGSDRLPGLA